MGKAPDSQSGGPETCSQLSPLPSGGLERVCFFVHGKARSLSPGLWDEMNKLMPALGCGLGCRGERSGSLPWGAHREGVPLVTEMTFTESWPALRSSQCPPRPTHSHTVTVPTVSQSHVWLPKPLGAVFWKVVCWVDSSLASLFTPSSHPDHHHSPLRMLMVLRVLSSPQPESSVVIPPQHIWETREIQPRSPTVYPPGGRSLLTAVCPPGPGAVPSHTRVPAVGPSWAH